MFHLAYVNGYKCLIISFVHRKSFHQSSKNDCECEKCGDKEIGVYRHLARMPKAKSLTLAQVAKMKK
jgi:hypothetical protein